MKIDRLVAITMYLLNRETVSAVVLAEKFEVSKRTIQRDIETLNQAGIPIVSTLGTSGGYSIIDGFKLTKQIAGIDDYLNIITALKGLHSAYNGKKINATLEKALTLMQGGEQRIFIDFSSARENIDVNGHLQITEKAVNNKSLLKICYTNSENFYSERIVEPVALSYQWYAWYLFAFCPPKNDYRLFKMPRISHCEIIPGAFSKEHENIETLMKNRTGKDMRKYYKARILCKSEIKQQVLEYLSSNIVDDRENGDFIIEINLPFERMWFSLLLGFGDKVRVLDCEELKNMLKQKAKEILSVYCNGDI